MSPALQVLRGYARRIWGDPGARRAAFEELVACLGEHAPREQERSTARIDRAVVAALRAAGLPRGRVSGVAWGSLGTSLGVKRADCQIVFDPDLMRFVVETLGSPEDALRTWTHESLHARQPYSENWRLEHGSFRGYEEGLVEGLARHVVRDIAGLAFSGGSYDYYVAAYETLASVTGVEVHTLWRALWRNPTGTVRQAFAQAVAATLQSATEHRMTAQERTRLVGAADILFATNRRASRVDHAHLERVWKSVIR